MVEREDLVLLHGFAGTRRTWDGVLSHLDGERYRPLALDLPGHGEQAAAFDGLSDAAARPVPAGAKTPDAGRLERGIDFAACVESVLERSPRRFALCGYSLGGRIALHIALAAPDRLSRLLLVASSAGIEDSDERAQRRAADRDLADTIEAGTIEQFADRWCAQAMFAHDPPDVQALARADYLRNDPLAIAAVLRGLGTGEMASLWSRLPELATPAVVIAGYRDEKFQGHAWRMVELVPGARLRLIVGGHRLPLESPAAVAAAICS